MPRFQITWHCYKTNNCRRCASVTLAKNEINVYSSSQGAIQDIGRSINVHPIQKTQHVLFHAIST